MKHFLLIVLFTVLSFPVFSQEVLIPSCQSTELEEAALPQKVEVYQNAFRNLEYAKEQSTDIQFFTGFRDFMKKRISENLFKMKALSSCLDLDKEKLLRLGFHESVADRFLEKCPQLIEGVREQVASHWFDMRSALEISNTGIQASLRGNFTSKVNLHYRKIPIEDDGVNRHDIKGLVGNGNSQRLEPLSQNEKKLINKMILEEMNKRFSSLHYESFENPFSRDSQISFLERYPRSPEKVIELVKSKINEISGNCTSCLAPQAIATKWDGIDPKHDQGSVREFYKDQYFKVLSQVPLLGYLTSIKADEQELKKALGLFIETTESFLEKLSPSKDNNIKLQHISHYLPLINEYLSENQEACGYANIWLKKSYQKENRARIVRMASSLGLGAACLGSFFFMETGAPLIVCSASSAFGLYEYSVARREMNEITQSTMLNVSRLEANSFKELKAAQQEEFLLKSFAVIDLLGAGADAAALSVRSYRLLSSKGVSYSGVMSGKTLNVSKMSSMSNLTDEALGTVAKELDNARLRAPVIKEEVIINSKVSKVATTKAISDVIEETKTKLAKAIRRLENTDRPLVPKDFLAFKKKVLASIKDAKLKRGFSITLDSIHNQKFLEDYFTSLQADTFATMFNSGDPSLIEKAIKGVLDVKVMEDVLEARAGLRGQRMVVVTGRVPSDEFNQYIGSGAIIDRGFSEGSAHGVFTHLVQQDMTYDLIMRHSGYNLRRLEEFLRTPEGMRLWDQMYDGWDSALTNPEAFGASFVQPILNLTFLRLNKVQDHVA